MATSFNTLLYIIEGRDQLTTTMRKISGNMAGLGAKSGLSFGARMKKALDKVGPMAFASLAVGFGMAAKSAIGFESRMNKLQALVGMSKKQVDGLKGSVLNLAGETAKSPQELADALYFIASSGFDGKQAMDILKASAKAAASGLGETQQVADAVTSALNAYKGTGLTASDTTDILTEAVKQGKAEADEFAGSIGRVIPISSQLGVGFDEVAGAMASMTLTGMKADEAATATRQIFVSLLKPSSQAQKQLSKMGLSFDDVRSSLKQRGLLPTLQMLKDKIGNNKEAMGRLFPNVRALNGFLALTGTNGKQTAKVMGAVSNSAGATDRAFKAASQTTEFKLKKAWASLQATGIKLGSALLPIIGAIAGAIAKVVSNGTAMKVIIGVLAAIAAAWAAMHLVDGIMHLISTVKMLKGAFQAVSGVMKLMGKGTWIGLLLTAIALLVTWIITHWQTVKKVLGAIWRGMVAAWRVICNAFGWLWRSFVNFFKNIFKVTVEIVKGVWNGFVAVWRFVIGLLRGAWRGFTGFFKGIWDAAVGVVKAAWNAILNAGRAVWRWIKKNWPYLVGMLGGPFGLAAVFVINHWRPIRDFFKRIFEAILGFAKKCWDGVAKAFKWVWEHILRPVIKVLWDAISSVIGGILHATAAAFGWVPWIGGKLKDAARAFDRFRDSVNRSLSGITQEPFNPSGTGTRAGNDTAYGRARRAVGGLITGMGTATSDSNFARVSTGEYIMRASAVSKYGVGMMNMLNAGAYARGGLVGAFANGGAVSTASVPGSANPVLATAKLLEALVSAMTQTSTASRTFTASLVKLSSQALANSRQTTLMNATVANATGELGSLNSATKYVTANTGKLSNSAVIASKRLDKQTSSGNILSGTMQSIGNRTANARKVTESFSGSVHKNFKEVDTSTGRIRVNKGAVDRLSDAVRRTSKQTGGHTGNLGKNKAALDKAKTAADKFNASIKLSADRIHSASYQAGGYTRNLGKIPASKSTKIRVSGTGSYKVTGAAKGGVMPGYTPGIDNHLIAVSGGEGILTPEAVNGIGGANAIHSLNRMFAGGRGAGRRGSRYGHYATGGQVIAFAKTFLGKVPYVLGGGADYAPYGAIKTPADARRFGGWDCAGFVGQMYGHFGIGPGTRGINVGKLAGWGKPVNRPQIGGFATEHNGGHVVMIMNPRQSIQAAHTGTNTVTRFDSGAWQRLFIPPRGFNGSGWAATPTIQGYKGYRQVKRGGKTAYVEDWSQAVAPDVLGSWIYGMYGKTVTTIEKAVADAISAATMAFLPGAFSEANLVNLARYMMAHGYSKAAAAGIAGNVYRESGGNPLSQGTGGRGLIGWTPPGTLPNRAFIPGNPVLSFNRQLAEILKYNQIWSQYIPMLNRARTPEEAAQIYSRYFERPGIPAMSQRTSMARRIFQQLAQGGIVDYDRGGVLRPGYTLAYNGTGRDEYVSPGGGPTVVVNGQAFLGSRREVARWVTDALTEYERKGGKVPWSK